MTQARAFPVLPGGAAPLSTAHREALAEAATCLRTLDKRQARALRRLLRVFRQDRYLARLREHEIPALKILAEVINGWDAEGVREFARAWASTLVARQDGFDWESSSPEEKGEHWERVRAELRRRGL